MNQVERTKTFRHIKRLIKQGFDNEDIATDLNDQGYKTGAGLEWSKTSVSTFLAYQKKIGAGSVSKPKTRSKAPNQNKLQAIENILLLELDPSERIALALMVVQS